MAKAAELNGYPGPAHVLTLAKELKLTESQRQQVQAIFDRMNAAARPLGAKLVEREQALDRLFASGEITASSRPIPLPKARSTPFISSRAGWRTAGELARPGR